MNLIRKFLILFLIFGFLAGGHFYATHEGFSTSTKTSSSSNSSSSYERFDPECPDVLLKRGNQVLLYNTKRPQDDMNPRIFPNLDAYLQYLEKERAIGNQCPVLFLQQESNTQGQDVLRVRPSPTDLQGGLPSTPISEWSKATGLGIHPSTGSPLSATYIDSNRANPPYNSGMYPGFDPAGLYQGRYTSIDEVHASTQRLTGELSENPMDPKWGGVLYTQNAVQSGKYKENEVVPPTQANIFTEKSDNVKMQQEPRNIYA